MRNMFYITLILGLCFLGKAQAQDNVEWTSNELNKVNNEIQLLEEQLPLTKDQKESLKQVFLRKNRNLAHPNLSTVRRNRMTAHNYLNELTGVLNSEGQSGRIDSIIQDKNLLEILNLHKKDLKTNV